MPQNPIFTLNGYSFFESTLVGFQVIFENAGDASVVQAYEWYLDNILVIGQATQQYNGQVACGNHSIGVRVLSGNNWTGIQQLSFETCKTILSANISGPDLVNINDSAAYSVIWQFSDGTTANVTERYTFSSTNAGSFSGNIFTATGDGSIENSIAVTITASKNGDPDLTKSTTVYNPDAKNAGLLVVDLFNNNTLNVIGFINNAEVTENHIAAYTGANIIPTTSNPSDAFILTSDYVNQPQLNWRYIFNLAKLKSLYPATANFVFYLKGRASAIATINGSFTLKNLAATMALEGSPGSYLPFATGGGDLYTKNFSSELVGGANGSYAEADLTAIIALTFNVATNSITYTTHQNPIEVNDFDFMTVRYSWDGGGTDLDIMVGFENNGTLYDGIYVGYGQPNATVPPDKVPKADAYLWWGSDNQTSAGSENVLVGIRKFIEDFPLSPDVIEVGLYAVWFQAPVTGNFAVELVTYKGGAMSQSGTDFVNTGGTLVSSNTVNVHTLITNQSYTPANAYKVGSLKYTKSTQTAVISIA